MAFESDFLDMFPHTIKVERYSGADAYDKPTWDTANPVNNVPCYIRDDVKVWKWEDGTESQSRRTIYTALSIGNKDRITLPAGFKPQVMVPVWVVRHADEEGHHHSQVYL